MRHCTQITVLIAPHTHAPLYSLCLTDIVGLYPLLVSVLHHSPERVDMIWI